MMQSRQFVGNLARFASAKKRLFLLLATGGLVGAFLLLCVINYRMPGLLGGQSRHVPEVLRNEDFQSSLDAEILSRLETAMNSPASSWLDTNVLKPYFDDVNTGQVLVAGVEITGEQFPKMKELAAIVKECATILHLPKVPRVFVVNEPSFNAYTTNFVDPIIVINADLIYAFETVDDLRFVIGHEMGHIACGHVKMMMVVRTFIEAFGVDKGGIKAALAGATILPLLQWCREAEITADRAALLCVQDLGKCEQTLARLATGLPESITGEINIDAFLAQGLKREESEFSKTYLFLKGLARSHPYPCARIKALREYHNSETYKHIMMD